jgi:hypothetical protein
METPPAIPPAKPPLGTQFYVLLLTPLALMAVFLCCANSGGNLAGVLMGLAALATLVCSILLARLLAGRVSPSGKATAGLGILMFLAVQAFYAVCFFVGCTAAVALA